MKDNFTLFVILISLYISLGYGELFSQTNDLIYKDGVISDRINFPMNFGILGGVNAIKSNAYIPLFPNNDDCGAFTSGIGNGIFAGINFGIEFYNSNIIADLRIVNETRPAALEETSSCFEVLSPLDDKYYPLLRDHSYTVDFSYLAVDLGIKLRLFKLTSELTGIELLGKIPIYIRIGFESGEALFSKTYLNKEEITSPEGVSFPNTNSTSNIVEEGDYDETISSESINFSLGAEFQIFKNVWLGPEFTYRYELAQSIEKFDWDMQILRFGVNLSVDLNKKDKIDLPTEEKNDTIIPEPIVDNKPKSKEYNNLGSFLFNEIDFTETIVTQTYPILPYIFFDSTSSKIRNAYNIQNSNFNETQLENSTLDIYYNVINVIASRMLKNPNSEITLIGNTDGIELLTNQERVELAKSRAMEVSKIFQSFGIDSKRLKIEIRDTPKLPTSDKYNEGLEENRRVDIETNELSLLEPVLHSDFFEFSLNKKLFFMSQIKNLEDIESISFNLSHISNKIYFESIDKIDNKVIYHKVNESILNNISALIENGVNSINANVRINYKDGEVESKNFTIPISKQKSAFEVGRLNLIVFDFDKSTISESNKNMIREFIASSIYDNSNTTITGSTDLLGEKEYNKTLSLQRANEVANYIKQVNPDYKINEIRGLGADKILFDNDTPEGRFYCRTVLVEVKTPIKSLE